MMISQPKTQKGSNIFDRFWQNITRAHPSIEDSGLRKQAELLTSLLLMFSLLASVRIVVAFISGSIYTDPTIPPFIVLILSLLGAYALSRTKFYLWAGVIALGALSTAIWVILIISGEYQPFDMLVSGTWLIISVLLGGLLFPWWGGLLWSIANIIPVFIVPNFFPGMDGSSLQSVWTMIVVVTGLILALNRNRDLQEQIRREELLEANRELEELGRGLEQRVRDAVRDLEIASEVGQRLSVVRDPETMLTEAVETIRDRFDLYYTQIYLLDASGRTLVLRAGTGEAGRTLLGRAHRLPVDLSSLNGTAVVERRAVIVADTAASTVHRPNPLLPDTRSEMVIPLISGERVVGVLDMQSTQPGALNPENLVAFEALAGQLAITIVNTELFTEIENARRQVEDQARRLTRGRWQEYLNAIDIPERIAFSYADGKLIEKIDEQSLQGPDLLKSPIQVSGQPIGEFNFKRDNPWTEDDTLIANAVAQQVSQQIETLRLVAQSERYQEEAREALRRLTREGWEGYQTQFGKSDIGFVYKENKVVPLASDSDGDGHMLTYDLLVGGEPIGEINIADVGKLSPEDAELVNSIRERLSAHLESIRLSQQTEIALSETAKLATELATVAEVGTTVTNILDPQEMLKTVTDLTKERFNLYHSHIYMYDEASNVLNLAAGAGDVGDQMVQQGWQIPVDAKTSLVAQAFRERRGVTVNDVQSVPDFLPNPLLPDTHSEMAVPLIVGDQVFGVMDIQSEEVGAFTEEDVSIQTTLASQIAVSLQNARTYASTQRQAEHESLINIISQRIQSTTDVEDALQVAIREVGRALGAKKTSVRLGTRLNK